MLHIKTHLSSSNNPPIPLSLLLVFFLLLLPLLSLSMPVSVAYYYQDADCSGPPLFSTTFYDTPSLIHASNASQRCLANVACILNPSDDLCLASSPRLVSVALNDTSLRSFLLTLRGTEQHAQPLSIQRKFHACFPSPAFARCFVVHVPLADLPQPSVINPEAPASTIVTVSLAVALAGLAVVAIIIFAVWRARVPVSYTHLTLPTIA